MLKYCLYVIFTNTILFLLPFYPIGLLVFILFIWEYFLILERLDFVCDRSCKIFTTLSLLSFFTMFIILKILNHATNFILSYSHYFYYFF